MDDHRIEVLLTTIQYGSFSKAADHLHCSQSAVTQSMATLEKELGCKILTRKHNGISLTPQGETLMPYILDADKALRALQSEASKLNEKRHSPIRIGTYSSVANTFLPKLLKKYQAIYPNARFQIRIGSDHLNQWLLEDEVDLILADEPHSKGARWYPLLEDPYIGVVSEALINNPDQTTISQEEFFRYPFIMASNNNYKTCIHKLPENSLNVVCDDDSTLVNMVSNGLGAALLPQLCIINPPKNIRILNIYPEFYRIIGLATQNKSTSKVQRFVDFILIEMKL